MTMTSIPGKGLIRSAHNRGSRGDMQREYRQRATSPRPWRRVAAAAVIALLLAAGIARAGTAVDATALLEQADSIKLRDRGKFDALMATIGARARDLSADQREYLLFLQGWNSAYRGNDDAALAQLSRLAADSRSVVLRYRAFSTLSALFTTERRYRAAFKNLGEAQNLLPRISDGRARAEGLLDAAELYGRVGQYDLALGAAQAVIDQNWAGEGKCMGGEEKLEALFNRGRFAEFDSEAAPTIDACLQVGEPAYANEIRVELAQRQIDTGRVDQARELLEKYSPQVRATGYAPQISSFDALFARVNEKQGNLAAAARFAAKAVQLAIPGQFPESLITAYGVLYRVAQRRGDEAAALGFYRKYAAAKMGYLNDISVRELAYQEVRQEDVTRKLEVQTLSRENRVLELKHELAAKEVQATRLYGVILTLILVFIGLWAVWTKRSQLHFKSLSRIDGLTGISNRLHFIERSEAALAYARKSGQDVCLLLFDLDHFKSINDRFGHATGDFVLKRTAARCREHLRRSDIFGRFGGEEFSVLLPGCGLEEARSQAEQLRRSISGIRADERSVTVTASASFGIACSTVSGYELARLLANADAALYRAKRAGRNCAMVHDTAQSDEAQAIVPATTQA